MPTPMLMDKDARAQLLAGMTGRRKCAILCLVLGKEFARDMVSRLSDEEAHWLSYEITQVGQVPREVTEAVVSEYHELLRGAELMAQGGFGHAKDLLESAFGKNRADDILRRVQKELSESGLGRLRKADPDQLRNLLRSQHPQIVALILAHMEPKQTATVINGLEPEFAYDVLLRMGRMEKVSPAMLELVEKSFGDSAMLGFTSGMSAAGGPAIVAEVLNHTPTSMEKVLLERMGDVDPEITEEIKNLMFVFEDIMMLDDRAVQRVVREVEQKDLALALKSSGPDIKAKIFKNMSERAGNGLKEEIELLGPVRVKDVDQARTRIVAVIRNLEEIGEIIISAGSGEDAIIS